MKYRLVSEYGNCVMYTENEREKNTLLERGFHIDEKFNKPKRKVVTTSEQNKDRAESDI